MATYTSHEYLPFSRIDRLYVTLLAPSNSGKTTLVCALHHASEVLEQNSQITYEADWHKSLLKMELVTYDRQHKECKQDITFSNPDISPKETTQSYMAVGANQKPYNIYLQGFSRARFIKIKGTDYPCLYTYHAGMRTPLQEADKKFEISILDYPGVKMSLGEVGESLAKRLEQSLAVIIPIDATIALECYRLMKKEKALNARNDASPEGLEDVEEKRALLQGMLEIKNTTDAVYKWLENSYMSKSSGVLFLVPVKCETFLEDEKLASELREAIYQLFFAPSGNNPLANPTICDQINLYHQNGDSAERDNFRKSIGDRINFYYAPVLTYGRVVLSGGGKDMSSAWGKDVDGNQVFKPEFNIDRQKPSGTTGMDAIFKQILFHVQ